MSDSTKVILLVFVIAFITPILIRGVFVGLTPTDLLVAVPAILVWWITRPKRKQQETQ